MVEEYYGEKVSPADFVIYSNKISGQAALPPLTVNRQTRMYYFPTPGFLALTPKTFRKILHDLLFCTTSNSIPEYAEENVKNIESLNSYYQNHKEIIVGTGNITGQIRVLDI